MGLFLYLELFFSLTIAPISNVPFLAFHLHAQGSLSLMAFLCLFVFVGFVLSVVFVWGVLYPRDPEWEKYLFGL